MNLMLASASFSTLDWAVLVGYFALLAVTGWLFSRREPSGAREYFLAGRQMPMWAVAISVLATATSAATFIGGPQEAYAGNLTYLSTNIGMFIAAAVVAVFFIPAFYRANVTTVYDLLEVRFGVGAKQAASWAFLLGRVFASGSRLYIAALPLSLILFRETEPWQLLVAIWVLSVIAILYTLVGGIRSIIWTDVIQTCVFVGAAVAALVMLRDRIPLSLGEIVAVLGETPAPKGGSKLRVIETSLDPSNPFSIWAVVAGFSLLGIASYGTDHDLAQRMLTCKTAAKGSQSIVVAILINLPVLAVFMSIGLLLHIFYQRPELMGEIGPGVTPSDSREVFLTYILDHTPSGMPGLMMAGLFAAGLGSTLSAINAMSAAFVNDCYKHIVPERTDRHYLSAGRWAVAGWGVVLGGFACVCVYWQQGSGQTLIQFALSVMTFAYAGLLGVFFTAIFTKRGNGVSAVAAIFTGFGVVTLLQKGVFAWWGPKVGLAGVVLAFPWHLLIAATITTAVCAAGRPARRGNVARKRVPDSETAAHG